MPNSEVDAKAGAGHAAGTRALHPLARAPTPILSDNRGLGRPLLVAVGVVAVAGLLVAYFGGVFTGKPQTTATETAAASAGAAKAAAAGIGAVTLTEPQMKAVKLGRVEQRSFVDQRAATGQIALNEDATTPIFPPYAGRVTRLFPKPGDMVKKGEPLFDIDSPDLVQAESTLIAAEATQAKARSQLDLTTHALARQRELFQAKATALKDLEQAQADQRSAESDARSATGALAAAQDAVRIFGKTDPEIERIKAQHRIDPVMPIFAPIGGTVVARKAGPGQYVQPSNSDPVYTIADLSTVWLIANVSELDVPFVHLGDAVVVKVAAYPKEQFRARITNIGAVVDPVTRRVTVRSEVEPRGFQLKPQMFASFLIVTDAGTPTAAVPTSALTRETDRTLAWVETSPRHFAARQVERGVEQDGMVQILSGLSPGETIATEGAVFLSNTLSSDDAK
jgi:cobalt-zinc-cadmium efflux system membrane fusion protein